MTDLRVIHWNGSGLQAFEHVCDGVHLGVAEHTVRVVRCDAVGRYRDSLAQNVTETPIAAIRRAVR